MDVFPALLEGDVAFHAHEIEAYWNDIGSVSELVQGNADALEGLVALRRGPARRSSRGRPDRRGLRDRRRRRPARAGRDRRGRGSAPAPGPRRGGAGRTPSWPRARSSSAASSAPSRPRERALGAPPGPEPGEVEIPGAVPAIEPGPPGVDLLVSAAQYEGAARDLVHGLKYGRRLGLAGSPPRRSPAPARPSGCAGRSCRCPRRPWRWRWRGFDPAEEIALALARLHGRAAGSLPRAPRRAAPGRAARGQARLADPPRVRLRRRGAPRRPCWSTTSARPAPRWAPARRRCARAAAGSVVALVLARAR